MRDFLCPLCSQRLAFESSQCQTCLSDLVFDLPEREFALLGAGVSIEQQRACANRHVAGCNWMTWGPYDLCPSCALTRTRPAPDDGPGMAAFAEAERAKRRLVMELDELGLPRIGRDVDPEGGLCFDLLSSSQERVMTGHEAGVITLDLAESDDVHREQLRVSMAEPYRTLLGHFRHEIGHYYYTVLASTGDGRRRFESLFGDPDTDYQAALDRHYSSGEPQGWQDHYISSYATMHPAEDWAETFAHYLHIRDTLDTAAAFGYAPAGLTLEQRLHGKGGFDRIIGVWLPLSFSLNMINRSMGHGDLYPFSLPGPVLEKMQVVHELILLGTPRTRGRA